MSRLRDAIARIDAANAEDPNQVRTEEGAVAKELLYGQRMSGWLAKLEPEASEELQLACRAQHLRRWESPRSDFPEGRAGYKAWRSDLLKRHAQWAGELMAEVGYASAEQERVAALIKKQNRSRDPESQTLEDAACLVFLEFEFDAFASKHSDDKLVDIVQKTWKKMSERAHEAALGLRYSERAMAIVERALAPGS